MKLLLNICLLITSLLYLSPRVQAQCAVNLTVSSNYNGADISCNGVCDGMVAAVGTNGTGPYTYLWSNATNQDTLFNACAATYYVTVTDAIGCTITDSITVIEPTVIVPNVSTFSSISCFGACSGAAIASPSGGTSNYYYLWDVSVGNQTTAIGTGLCAGIYTVTVGDINGCTAVGFSVMTEPTPIIVSTSHNDASCFGANSGTATVFASNGTSPYTYLWSNGETQSSISGLFSGFYTVTVVDANGCMGSSGLTITDSCPMTLTGVVRQDTNFNCVPDTMEKLMAYQLIRITNSSGYIGYVTTNQDGRYYASLDTGNYTLEIIPLNGPYWNSCMAIQNIRIDSTNVIDTINWTLETLAECPLLDVNIGTPFLRRAGGGSYYTVHYCNHGTAAANDAYVEVEIDSFLTVMSTSIPSSSQNGNVYTFDLDTIDVGECGYFYIHVLVNANAAIGQTHCSEAHIYPDSFCISTWNGPILNADGQCQNDTIFFKIKNTGNGMLSTQNYTIFEDDIIIHMGPFNLNGGDSIIIAQPVDSAKTYRVQANQALGFPAQLGPLIVHASIEGCLPYSTGNFNTGFLTQYYTGNTSTFIDIDCRPNIASYDPNDKAAQPMGYGLAHYIEANTPLKYHVRFQNTGTDTAFNIVIIDTLSTLVDPATIQMGASSHPYTWELSGTGILRITFANIMLVDSNANEPLSHGFFTYEINQMPNLANGSVINNQAAIYFDYNPPIFTNTTFHTIGENYIPIILTMQEAWIETMQVHLYPNPTSGLIFIEQSSSDEMEISVVDNLGRIVVQKTANDRKTALNLNQLTPGIYYVRIQQDQKISTHKIIKH